MKRLLKLCVFFAATSIFLVIIGSLAFYHLLRIGEFRRFLISQLEQETRLEVQLGEGRLRYWLDCGNRISRSEIVGTGCS